jgi:SNF2 family DNA or RNA helicase
LWDTGTGKTVLASAIFKLLTDQRAFDTAFFVVKAHNKVNTARALKRLTGLEAVVVEGTPKKRRNLYREALVGGKQILILNYEKFRVDKDEMKAMCDHRDIAIVWDEMPKKLGSRTSKLYKSITECLYRTTPPAVSWSKKRPKSLRQVILTADGIENSPEDWFNCVRIVDPRIYGTVNSFHDEFVARWSYFNPNKPDSWHNLDKMGLMVAHIVHQVDKSDPAIAAQFPEAIPENRYIDWDPKDRKIYDLVAKEADKLGLGDTNVLSMIGVMQMLCNAPTMINNSAAMRESFDQVWEYWAETDGAEETEPIPFGSEAAQKIFEALGDKILVNDRHTKIETLRELLVEDHPDEKALVFSSFNDGLLPILEEWGVTYVRYNGTDKQKQKAEDDFKTNPDIQVFLSSDQGSDSLNLEEASVVIHYDLPWKWTTFNQRQNRIHRVVSQHDTVRYYVLLMADSVEDRKMEIIMQKLGYHDAIFKGAAGSAAKSVKMTREDLEYILSGGGDG